MVIIDEILEIDLGAFVFEDSEGVFVEFVGEAGTFFEAVEPSRCLIDALIHEKDGFVKMCFFAWESPV